MDIRFSDHVSWSFERDSIIFGADADGQRITCVVPMEFLTAPLAMPLTGQEARSLFNEQRSRIEGLLRRRIAEGSFSSPGEIILNDIEMGPIVAR